MRRPSEIARIDKQIAALFVLVILVGPLLIVPSTARGSAQATPGPDAGRFDPLAMPWLEIRTQELLDLNGNGEPDGIRLFGYWLSAAGDTLTVYRDSEGFAPGAEYRQVLDYSASTWVFDVETDGNAELAIRFTNDGVNDRAELWDDQDDDGQVAVEGQDGRIAITESSYPTLTMDATGQWFNPDGSVNYDLHGSLNGCGFCNRIPTEGGYPPGVERRFTYDSVPDFTFSLADSDHDGIPESYSWRMATAIDEASYGLPRFGALSNEGNVRPADPTNYLFWPHLSLEPPGRAGNYFDTAPFIPVDWEASEVDLLTLDGYPIETGFHINSYAHAPVDVSPIEANFEIPMAYYDLAGDQDNHPELHVRIDYYRANDPIFIGGRSDHPFETVRYSWNQTNGSGLAFDYKVDVAGRYPIDTSYAFGDLEVAMIPYPELPAWVTDRAWEVCTFVAVMDGGGYQSSEGLYEWGTLAAGNYISGISMNVPSWTTIAKGMRGEYRVAPGKAELYIDPVDGQLHLLGLESGTWQVSDTRMVRYMPGVDDEVGGWQVWDGGSITSQLYRVPGGLLYSDEGETLFLETDLTAEPFRSLPPASHGEWAALARELESSQPNFPANDLRAMFDQFGDSPTRISTGPMLAFVRTADGVSFTVDASDTETVESIEALTGSEQIGSTQSINLSGSEWTSFPAELVTPEISILVDPIGVIETVPVQITVHNSGALGLKDASLRVRAVSNDEQFIVPLDPGLFDVDIDAGGAQTFEFAWAPGAAGDWTITAEISRDTLSLRTGETVRVVLAGHEQGVVVLPNLTPSVRDTSLIGWAGTMAGRIALMAALMLSAFAAAGMALWRGARL